MDRAEEAGGVGSISSCCDWESPWKPLPPLFCIAKPRSSPRSTAA
jgi:hypothetical protein